MASSLKSSFIGILLTCILAVLFRTFVFEPYHIPSSSMKPNLLIGDYVFVNKMSYGYSKYSIPFHPNFFHGKVMGSVPKRGDVVVFVPESDKKSYYVKRVVGIPGDLVVIDDRKIFVNSVELKLKENGEFKDFIEGFGNVDFDRFVETNQDDKSYDIIYFNGMPSLKDATYKVPENSLFVMGDNRDNSKDSRFLDVSFVPVENVIGKPSMVFFSIEEKGEKREDLWDRFANFIRFRRIFHLIN